MTQAYIDSFAGLVPCRIVAIGDWSDRNSMAKVRITATRGAYKRGEMADFTLTQLVPRSAVYRSRQPYGQYRIRAFTWSKES